MANTGEAAGEKDDFTTLNLRIPRKLKHRFKVWCAEREREMTDVLIEHIKAITDSKPKPRR